MERGTIRLIALVIVYIFYLSVGAAIFSSIEGPYEQRILSDLRKKRDDFLLKHPCVTDEELESFVKHVMAAQEMGIQPLGNASDKRSWGFGSSFFFAGTVITTIGKDKYLTGGQQVCNNLFSPVTRRNLVKNSSEPDDT